MASLEVEMGDRWFLQIILFFIWLAKCALVCDSQAPTLYMLLKLLKPMHGMLSLYIKATLKAS